MKIVFRHALLLAILAAPVWGCSSGSNPTPNNSAAWTFSEVSGNFTTSFPRTVLETTLESSGTLTIKTEQDDGSVTTVVSQKSATITQDELSRLVALMAPLNLKNQKSLDIADGCTGGGAQLFTYAEAGSDANQFSIEGGCGADIQNTDRALGDFVDAFGEITSRYAQ